MVSTGTALRHCTEHHLLLPSLFSTAEELAGDDFQGQNGPHALKNWQHLRIDHVTRDGGFFRIPPATVQQLAFLGEPHGHIAG